MWNDLSTIAAFLGSAFLVMVLVLWVFERRRRERIQVIKKEVSDRLARMGLLTKSMNRAKRNRIGLHIIWIRRCARQNNLPLTQLGTSEKNLDRFRSMMEHGSSSRPALAKMPAGFAPAGSWRFGDEKDEVVKAASEPKLPQTTEELFSGLTENDLLKHIDMNLKAIRLTA
ncbi:MAG: hypothetical protein U9Q03_06125 [Patescibacteria group bacterium]|nr:hypothetical protein [Patescibacteria group bacterium]